MYMAQQDFCTHHLEEGSVELGEELGRLDGLSHVVYAVHAQSEDENRRHANQHKHIAIAQHPEKKKKRERACYSRSRGCGMR